MSAPFRCTLFCTLFCAVSSPARADWYVTPFIGFKFGTSTTFLDIDQAAELRKVTFGAAGTNLGAGPIGVEGEFSVIPGFFERDPRGGEPFEQGPDPCCLVVSSRVTTIVGNVVVAVPLSVTGYGLRPFASGGAGLMRATAVDPADEGFKRNLFAINAGGGLIGPISDNQSVRFDLRYFRNVKTRGRGALNENRPSLGFWRASVGLMFKF